MTHIAVSKHVRAVSRGLTLPLVIIYLGEVLLSGNRTDLGLFVWATIEKVLTSVMS